MLQMSTKRPISSWQTCDQEAAEQQTYWDFQDLIVMQLQHKIYKVGKSTILLT